MKGETIHIQIDPDEAHVFSAETGRRVSGDAVAAPAPGAAAAPRGHSDLIESDSGRAAAGPPSTPGGPSPPHGSSPRPSQCPKECTCAPDRGSPRPPRWAPSPSSRPAASSEDGGGGAVAATTPATPSRSCTPSRATRKTASRPRSSAWAEENDYTVNFSQTGNFNQLINTRVQGNDAPDVALFPQPGHHARHGRAGPARRPLRHRRPSDLDNLSRASWRPARSTARSTRCR